MTTDDTATPPNNSMPEISGNAQDGTTPRLGITTCGEESITTTRVATSLGIAQTGRGSAMMFGMRDNQLVGYGFAAGVLATDPAGTPIAINAKILRASTTRLGASTIVTSVGADDTILVDRVMDNLRDVRHIATVQGRATADSAMVTAPGGYLLPTIDEDGIHLDRFDLQFRMTSETVITTALAPQGVAASTYFDNNSMVAWSANNECHLAYADTTSENDGSFIRQACPSPTVAVNPHTGEGLVAYHTALGVMVNRAPYGHLGTPTLLRRDTTSPQVVFDGQHFWIAFVDQRQQLIVGLFDDQNHFISAALPHMSPEAGNYRLQMLDGQATVVSTDSSGYSVQRMCTRTL